MRKLTALIAVLCVVAFAAPGYAFIDYLFGGSSNTEAIDNSALGDLRAWWTGNPAYQFNPYYSGGPLPTGQQQGQGGAPPAAGSGQQQYMQVPQPPVNPYGPSGYGQGVPAGVQQYGAAPPGYQPAPQGYAPPQQAYPQAPPQGYQAPPQGYQAPQPQQGYQAQPQGYQMPAAQPGQQTYGGAGFVPGYGYPQ
jgi:hypothetical protein